MNKLLHLIFSMIAFCLLATSNVFAQSPQAIPYQAVARNASGEILDTQNISLRISIHDVTATGMVVFKETHSVTTNSLGLFTINIGSGIALVGTLSTINWSTGSKFIQVEMDPTGGTSYVDMGTTQLNSVPYALYAETANVPGVAGPQGPIGLTGATGAQGPTGLLTSGSAAGNTPYWNGTSWVVNNSNVFNNGTNVGIGTASPIEKLQISSTTDEEVSVAISTSESNLLLRSYNNSTIWPTILRAGTGVWNTQANGNLNIGNLGTGSLHFSTGSNYTSPAMSINNTGNVGIGTATPSAKLEIAGTIKIADGTQGVGKILTSNATGLASWANAATLPWSTSGNNINSSNSGNVGVGTTSPPTKFSILGTAASPSIPGTTSTGILRVGVSSSEGIDIGKMNASPYLGWMQAGTGGTTADPIVINPSGGNVGIGTGTTTPAAKLDINGTIKISGGAPSVGKVLSSDANGLASWVTPSLLTGNFVDLTTAQAVAGIKTWTNDASFSGKVGIGTSSPSGELDVKSLVPVALFVDQQQLNDNGYWGALSWWQSFTPGVTGQLNNIILRLASPLSGGASSAITINVYSGQGTGGTLLATVSTTISGGSFVDRTYTFATPPTLTAGNQYSFQIVVPVVIAGFVRFDYNNSYAGGESQIGPTWDLYFKTTMTGLVNVNTLTAINGNVGIGTVTPSAKLEIVGATKTSNLQITNGASNGALLSSDANGFASWVTPSLGTGNFVDLTTAQAVAGIKSWTNNALFNGNVGIHTSSPSGELDVKSGVLTTFVDQQQLNVDAFGGDLLLWWQSFTPGVTGQLNNIILKLASPLNGGVSSPITINVYSGQGTGGMLLATVSTTISGASLVDRTYTFATPPMLTAGNQYSFQIVVPSIDVSFVGIGYYNYYTGGESQNHPTWDLYFKTTMTGLVNVNTLTAINGNVGIGTVTPSAKLEIAGTIKIADGTEGVGKILTSDATGLASWANAATLPWSTSGNNINSSNSGNVGIGTATPGAKLEIAGATKTSNLQITNGASNGAILTSDANGNATWTNVGCVIRAQTWTASASGANYIAGSAFAPGIITSTGIYGDTRLINSGSINTTTGSAANTGLFTAPSDGYYELSIRAVSIASSARLLLLGSLNGASPFEIFDMLTTSPCANCTDISHTQIIYMQAGDTHRVLRSGNSTAINDMVISYRKI